MDFKRQYGGISEAEIAAFETEIGYFLPIDYKEFLKLYNGGIPVQKKFLINSTEGYDSIDIFFGINLDKEFLSLNYYHKYYYDRFQMGIFPIGEDPGGNYICIDLNQGERYGCIYFYDHEVENQDGAGNITRDNLYLTAHSFTEFIKSLH